MLEFALNYARRGWPVIPVHSIKDRLCTCLNPECHSPGKHPRTLHGVKDATTDEKQIRTWWTNHPNANIGIVMGEKAGVVAIDLDTKNDGPEHFYALEAQHGKLPPTARSITGSLGYHYLVKPPKFPVKNKVAVAPGVDIRGDNGFIVAPPSLHVTGRKYCWESECEPETVGIAEAPEWLWSFFYDAPKKKVGKIGEGSRNSRLFNIGCALRGKGATEDDIHGTLLQENKRLCVPPLDEAEVADIARKAAKYVPDNGPEVDEEVPEEKPEQSKDWETAPFYIWREFLKQHPDTHLRYCREEWFLFNGKRYDRLSDPEFYNLIGTWMGSQWNLQKFVGKAKMREVINCFKTQHHFVPDHVTFPALNGETVKTMVPMENGIFDVKTRELIPHTPNFLCTYVLPYNYDQKATCPTYDRIAKDIFSNYEMQLIWEEIMGVHLYCPAKLEKFFILYGEGGNGKTLLLTILTALLGKENVSNVTLESFANDSFLMYETVGKLANIIPELPEMDKANEGIIKSFATREGMTFDRKFKSPVKAIPTAFLTMATNTKPRFQDKSDGIWRRMMLFTLTNQVSEEKQDKRLIDTAFWEKSGELSGIFNRALLGLHRVIERGYLLETDGMRTDKADYRLELNTVAQFILEWCGFEPGCRTLTAQIYHAYKEFVLSVGGRPMGAHSFSSLMKAEAKRMGHHIEIEKKIVRMGEVVGRAWSGLKLVPHIVREAQSEVPF